MSNQVSTIGVMNGRKSVVFRYCNPHPQGKIVGDCVKRAITIASGKDYNEVKRELNRFKKRYNASVFNDWRKNVEPYIKEELNGVKMSFPAVRGQKRMSGYKFCSEYPRGTYILQMANHVVCCKDGCLYDTWDCGDKCVYTAYKINL